MWPHHTVFLLLQSGSCFHEVRFCPLGKPRGRKAGRISRAFWGLNTTTGLSNALRGSCGLVTIQLPALLPSVPEARLAPGTQPCAPWTCFGRPWRAERRGCGRGGCQPAGGWVTCVPLLGAPVLSGDTPAGPEQGCGLSSCPEGGTVPDVPDARPGGGWDCPPSPRSAFSTVLSDTWTETSRHVRRAD